MKTRRDRCHHHPQVTGRARGGWQWECACGGHSPRAETISWRRALVGALGHAQEVTS